MRLTQKFTHLEICNYILIRPSERVRSRGNSDLTAKETAVDTSLVFLMPRNNIARSRFKIHERAVDSARNFRRGIIEFAKERNR